jgi:spermidine synthase
MASRSAQGQQPVDLAPTATGGILWRALLLIISGTAALLYPVLGIKQLTLIVGVDVYAVTIGVSAFFAGLALGGLLLGRWVDRVQRPLRLYSALEIGVALVGVVITIALAHSAALVAHFPDG